MHKLPIHTVAQGQLRTVVLRHLHHISYSLVEACVDKTKSPLEIFSKEREGGGGGVLWVRSVPISILPFCQYMKDIALLLHRHKYSW